MSRSSARHRGGTEAWSSFADYYQTQSYCGLALAISGVILAAQAKTTAQPPNPTNDARTIVVRLDDRGRCELVRPPAGPVSFDELRAQLAALQTAEPRPVVIAYGSATPGEFIFEATRVANDAIGPENTFQIKQVETTTGEETHP
jgi:hypothetical protein